MHLLQKRLLDFISSNSLFKRSDKLLVALSGGRDSVVLSDLLIKSGFTVYAAHCNFRLRGHESNEDELFVRQLCNKQDIDLHVKQFDTLKFSEANKYSVEEAARVLRYEWFNELCLNFNYDYILTAHHLNDKIETFFINLSAGTGIRGIRSIQAVNGNIIRPLLFAEQDEIKQYANDFDIVFRTDQSNFNTDIVRNRIRHKIFPEFLKINSSFSDVMKSNFQIFNDLEEIYNNYIENSKQEILSKNGNILKICIPKLLQIQGKTSVLFELLKTYGFNSKQLKNLASQLPTMETGKYIISEKYKLIKDRDYLILDVYQDIDNTEFEITHETSNIECPVKLSIRIQQIDKNFHLIKKSSIAFLDRDTVKFPLKIRKKKTGDRFIPLGMKGTKLLSDFTTDLKLSYIEKKNLYVLTNTDGILWVIGHRIDDRYKVTDKTRNVLIIEHNPNIS
jgi:tRNA(Ile)-lysidine synthase